MNGEDAVNNIMTFGEDEISLQSMNFALSTSIVKATPKWGQRAFSAFFDWKQNGIVYYMDDLSPQEMQSDWKITLMIGIKEWISDNPSLFLPIVQSWSRDEGPNMRVPPLRKYLDVKSKDELPQLFLYHPTSNTAMKYPEPLEDVEKVSPELVMSWAKSEVLKMEVAMLERRLREFDDPEVPAENKLTEEQKPRAEMHVNEMKPVQLEFEADHALLKESLKERNTFADKVKEQMKAHPQKDKAPETPKKEASEDEVHVEL